MPRMESYDKRKTSVREHERKTKSGKKTTVREHERRLNPENLNRRDLSNLVRLSGQEVRFQSREELEKIGMKWLEKSDDKDKVAMYNALDLDEFRFKVGEIIRLDETKKEAEKRGFKLRQLLDKTWEIEGKEYPELERESDSTVMQVNEFEQGTILTMGDGTEFVVYDSYDEVEELAIESVRKELESDPESFDEKWLKKQIDTESLGESMANEFYDGDYDEAIYEWGNDNPDKEERFSELGKKRDDAFRNKTNIEWSNSDEGEEYFKISEEKDNYAENEANRRSEEIKDDPIQFWLDATGDFPPSWKRYIDLDKASKDRVNEDGITNILGFEDREYHISKGRVAYESS